MGSRSSKDHSSMGTSTSGSNMGSIYGQDVVPRGKSFVNYASSRDVVHARRIIDRGFSKIGDDYRSLEQVTEALRQNGLESSNLILAIDFTKSNEWTGKMSYNNRSLHDISHGLNPYQQAISIIGKTLSAFDDDNLIPCYGFGDVTTRDNDVFSFNEDDMYCKGFDEALMCYRELVPQLRLAGPTSFAPAIEMAMTIVEKSGGQYHVLVIIADGQVTGTPYAPRGQTRQQELQTVQALVDASKYPLSIILVGVGDGPWDTMEEFDDNIPARDFDNFQFVNFTKIMSKNLSPSRKEAEFALAALMEIPSQYKATIELNLLGRKTSMSSKRLPLPPPFKPIKHSPPEESWISPRPPEASIREPSNSISCLVSEPPTSIVVEESGKRVRPSLDISASSSSSVVGLENQICPICLTEPKNMAFSCGHQTCRECGERVSLCPMCRKPISSRIKLY